MKKIIATIILAVMFMASSVLAVTPGTCVQTPHQYFPGAAIMISFVCTDSPDGGGMATQTVTSAAMELLKGAYFLYSVTAYPTTGGTAPDAADVAVLMNGMDLLGTKGANLIHPTATNDVYPHSSFMDKDRYAMTVNTITMTITNQATASANYTIEMLFSR